MYDFILNLYRMGRIGEPEILVFAEKGLLTQDQATQILRHAKG